MFYAQISWVFIYLVKHFIFSFLFWPRLCMWKFWDQGSNTSHSSVNAWSLTHWATGELLVSCIFTGQICSTSFLELAQILHWAPPDFLWLWAPWSTVLPLSSPSGVASQEINPDSVWRVPRGLWKETIPPFGGRKLWEQPSERDSCEWPAEDSWRWRVRKKS